MASFLSNFFKGSDGKEAANAAAEAQKAGLRAAYGGARKESGAGYDSADSILTGYEKPGQQAYSQYADSIGVNGQEGYGRAFQNFGQDPFLAGSDESNANVLTQQFRKYNSRGMGDSGASRLALARTNSDMYAQRVADYRNRLMGMGQQGAQFGTMRAGNAIDRGNRFADYAIGEHTGLANAEAGRIGNIYQAQQQGRNNLLGAIGTGIGLAAAPFTGGASLGMMGSMRSGMGPGSTIQGQAGGAYASGLPWA